MADKNNIGKIGWLDITVDDAAALRNFYATVVGWKPEAVSMSDYVDYNMTMPATGDPTALAGGRFAIIEDPVGAITALYQEP